MEWTIKRGNELQASSLYEILRQRMQVFVIEQKCMHLDLDGLDLLSSTYHVQGWEADEPVCNLRILFEPDHIRIGKVLVSQRMRGRNCGQKLMQLALTTIDEKKLPAHKYITLSAEEYVYKWYERFGFERDGATFDKGGVTHQEMTKPL